MIHDVRRNDGGDRNAHVGIIGRLYGGAQIAVLDVTHHAPTTGGGYDTVEEQIDSDEVHSFGADITRVCDLVTTDSPSDMVQDGLFGSMGTDNMQVGGMVVMGNC